MLTKTPWFRKLVAWATGRFPFTKRLPRDLDSAPVVVVSSCGLRYLWWPLTRVDPVIVQFAREFVKPGMTVWDVGANLGVFTIAAAKRAGPSGRVIALEPQLMIADLLRRTIEKQRQPVAEIQLLPVACASNLSVRRFIIADSRPSSSLEHSREPMGGQVAAHAALTIDLDTLSTVVRAPDIIKIDIEGAEVEALRGAIRVLEQCRPLLLIEVGSESADEVSALLRAARYTMYDFDQPGPDRTPVARAGWNCLAIPQTAL